MRDSSFGGLKPGCPMEQLATSSVAVQDAPLIDQPNVRKCQPSFKSGLTAHHQMATFSRFERHHRSRKPTGSFRAAERTFRKRPTTDIWARQERNVINKRSSSR